MIVRGREEEGVCYYGIEGGCLLLENKGIATVTIGYKQSSYSYKTRE